MFKNEHVFIISTPNWLLWTGTILIQKAIIYSDTAIYQLDLGGKDLY